jgi:protein-disulfide isomerase
VHSAHLRLTLSFLLLLTGTACSTRTKGAVPVESAREDDGAAQRSQGATAAPVTIYEMADFQCPACRAFALSVLPSVEQDYIKTGKVHWIFINLPLVNIHKNTIPAAEVAMCAGRQGKFWPMHDLLYHHQDDWAQLDAPLPYLLGLGDSLHLSRAALTSCVTTHATRAAIDADAAASNRAGAHVTPTFYIEGGLLEGAAPYPEFRNVLDSIYAAKTTHTGS